MKLSGKQKGVRPTTGKVREALFDILRGKIESTCFLDLFAGTGAVGIGALNAGAEEVVFVEERKASAKKISDVLTRRGVSERTTVLAKKALSYIEWAEQTGISFDIIFLDPPYHSDDIMQVLTSIGGSQIIKQKGIVVAEHFAKKSMPDSFNKLHKMKDYNYGDTVLTLYEAL